MQASVSVDGAVATVVLAGRFDYNAHRDFREAIDQVIGESGVQQLILDFRHVDYLDSSALGMLMLLKERADAQQLPVTLAYCTGAARQVLEIANFNQLFLMD